MFIHHSIPIPTCLQCAAFGVALKGRGFSGAEIIDPQNNLSFRALRSRAAARWARNPLSADTTTAHVKWKDRVERTLLSVAFDAAVDPAVDFASAPSMPIKQRPGRARLQSCHTEPLHLNLSFRSPSQPQSGEKGEEPAVCRHHNNACEREKRVERTLLSVAFDVDFALALDPDPDSDLDPALDTNRDSTWKSGASAPRKIPRLSRVFSPRGHRVDVKSKRATETTSRKKRNQVPARTAPGDNLLGWLYAEPFAATERLARPNVRPTTT
jgi:hypothetical protein